MDHKSSILIQAMRIVNDIEPSLPIGKNYILTKTRNEGQSYVNSFQGAIFAVLFPIFNRGENVIRNGVVFAWALGAFLASYIALAEAGKYEIPSISSWFAVEATAAAIQYTLFGVVLGLVRRGSGLAKSVLASRLEIP